MGPELAMSMRLRSLTLREIRLPLREAFRGAAATVRDRRILLLRLEDFDGFEAWSECVALEEPSYLPETVDTATHAIRTWFAPRLLGRIFATPQEVDGVLREGIRGHRMARAALEMGFWTLHSLHRGRSLAQSLGASRSEVEAGIALGFQRDAASLVERAEQALREGYRRVKVKIRPGAAEDHLRAAREALGPAAPLMADANGTYEGREDALRALDDLGLMMIEQPLGWDDIVRHGEIQTLLRTPVCLDESVTGYGRAREMAAARAGRVLCLKPGRVGGLTTSLRIRDLCVASGIALWCGGMLESGIGRAYNVALAALEELTLPGDLSPSARYWQQDIVRPEWTMSGAGKVRVPEGPGLGVEIDRDRIEDLTRSVTEFR